MRLHIGRSRRFISEDNVFGWVCSPCFEETRIGKPHGVWCPITRVIRQPFQNCTVQQHICNSNFQVFCSRKGMFQHERGRRRLWGGLQHRRGQSSHFLRRRVWRAARREGTGDRGYTPVSLPTFPLRDRDERAPVGVCSSFTAGICDQALREFSYVDSLVDIFL